jgi:hypothetical protein
VSFAAITLRVASQRVFIIIVVVYFEKLSGTHTHTVNKEI